jgi:hypothetical protein
VSRRTVQIKPILLPSVSLIFLTMPFLLRDVRSSVRHSAETLGVRSYCNRKLCLIDNYYSVITSWHNQVSALQPVRLLINKEFDRFEYHIQLGIPDFVSTSHSDQYPPSDKSMWNRFRRRYSVLVYRNIGMCMVKGHKVFFISIRDWSLQRHVCE